jgi:FAD dependent oxidoreductase TIGR03364
MPSETIGEKWDEGKGAPGSSTLNAQRSTLDPQRPTPNAQRLLFDAAVVGAGVIGLAHAYHLARSGRRVVVFERSPRAVGASIRNFGMVWPIGQPAGEAHETALRSRAIWQEVLTAAGIWHENVGSLHLAYHDDEAQVLEEFAGAGEANGYPCELLTPERVGELTGAIKLEGLHVALFSPTETCVDPRETIASLPGYLERAYGVRFEFGTAVTEVDTGRLVAGDREWSAKQIFLCTGDDLATLYPQLLQEAGLIRCKLQMMRSEPYADWRLGPMPAAGLTLTHYRCFAECPTLPAVKARIAAEMPDYVRYGIHVMASQNGRGELTLGDSHEYDDRIEPFDKSEIDELILSYLAGFLQAPDLRIASRWQGIYVKHPTEPYIVRRPAPGITLVTALGGAGMTLSFGLAERVVRETE